jgi:BON domain
MKTFGLGAALGWLASFFFDPQLGRRRRALAVDRPRGALHRTRRRVARAGRGVRAGAYGTTQKLRHLREEPKEYDDVTLAHKVESEVFRPADVPKGAINVNAAGGVVQLRGEVGSPELIDELVARTRRVQGVRDVENLLHLPAAPAPTHR